MLNKNYDIALSFAGEDRVYVEEVAHILDISGVAVFYDRFEEADLWGKNLYEHLQEIYCDKATYTIIFCSKHYESKVWTNHERRSAQERALKSNKEYILPVRFDDTSIPGVNDNVAYLDLSEIDPYSLCEHICKKLNKPLIDKNSYLLTKSNCPFQRYCKLNGDELFFDTDSCQTIMGWDCENCGAFFRELVVGMKIDELFTSGPKRNPDMSIIVKRKPGEIYPNPMNYSAVRVIDK